VIRYVTAGESHGRCLTAILEGVPAGVPVTEEFINRDLSRRQYSFGRGERLQYIEKDTVKILSGVRWGETLGDPVTLQVDNRDWENWETIMSLSAEARADKFRLVRPRPGHADLSGLLKFDRHDTRDILERASARETAARVAAGSLCRRFLEELGIMIYSFVNSVGDVEAKIPKNASIEELHALAEKSQLRTPDKAAEEKMVEAIKKAKAEGDTLGGVWTVVATGVPAGLGSHTQWDLKLDALLARAVMSIQAHKGVEFGDGFGLASTPGSKAHDEILHSPERGFHRTTNHAGGIEGGMSNGQPIVIRAALKPLASLRKPLGSVNIDTKDTMRAEIVRSDVCPIAAAAVIGEIVVATVLADQMTVKFGGDSLREIKDNLSRYVEHIRNF
jgi:chorismate synthase